MRIGKWDITLLFSFLCSLVINSGMVGVVVLHTQPPRVVNLRTWRPKPANANDAEAAMQAAAFNEDIPPPAPPPPKPAAQQTPPPPKPKPQFDPRQAFGETHGVGQALDSSPGDKPMQAQLGPQIQAFLGRNPPRLSGGGGGAGGQLGQAGKSGAEEKPQRPQQAMIGAQGPSESQTPRVTVQPKVAPPNPTVEKPNQQLAQATAPKPAPPTDAKPGHDDKQQTAVKGNGDHKLDKPAAAPEIPSEQMILANQPTAPQPKEQVAQSPLPPAPQPPPNAQINPNQTQPAETAPPPPVQVALAQNPTAKTDAANPANPADSTGRPGKPGLPGPPGPPAPPGPLNKPTDPAPKSDKDSDPFSDVNSFKFVNGKVQARNGRKVRTVKPQLTDEGDLRAALMGGANVTFLAKIDEKGFVIQVKLYKSSGSDAIDLPCEEALNQWWFEPSKDQSGHPIRDIISVTFGIY